MLVGVLAPSLAELLQAGGTPTPVPIDPKRDLLPQGLVLPSKYNHKVKIFFTCALLAWEFYERNVVVL